MTGRGSYLNYGDDPGSNYAGTIGGGAGSYGGGGLGSGSGGTPIWDGYTQGGQRLTLNTEAETSLGLAYTGTFDGRSGNFLKQGSDYLLLDHPGAVDGSVDEVVVTASRRRVQPFGMFASSTRSASRPAPSSGSVSYNLPNYPRQFAQDYNSARNGAVGTLRAGWQQLNRTDAYTNGDGAGAAWNTITGGMKLVGGGIGYVASPITGALNTIVGRPVEMATGGSLPREFVGDTALTIGSFFAGGAGATSRIGGAAERTGVTFEGTLYRAVPEGGNPLDISFSVNANGRYTAPGQGGLYFSSNTQTVAAEFANNGSSLVGRNLHSFPQSSVDNLLDLTNSATRESLGVSLQDLTRTGGTSAWRYEVTQPLGAYAERNGYSGIVAPSAQADGGVNLILFGSKGVR